MGRLSRLHHGVCRCAGCRQGSHCSRISPFGNRRQSTIYFEWYELSHDWCGQGIVRKVPELFVSHLEHSKMAILGRSTTCWIFAQASRAVGHKYELDNAKSLRDLDLGEYRSLKETMNDMFQQCIDSGFIPTIEA